jgi:hypothetical protein
MLWIAPEKLFHNFKIKSSLSAFLCFFYYSTPREAKTFTELDELALHEVG